MPPKHTDTTNLQPGSVDDKHEYFAANNGLLAQKSETSTKDKLCLTICDVAGTLSSGIAGGVAYSLLSKSEYGMAASLLGSALAGTTVNTSVKYIAENVLVSKSNRDLGWQDLMWGAANGLSGGVGAIAEKAVGRIYAENVGTRALGRQEDKARIREAGYRMFESSLSTKFKANILRGVAGGAAGAYAYSLPHSINDNLAEFKSGNVGAAVLGTAAETAENTVIGGVTGGALGGIGTALFNVRDIAGYTRATLAPETTLDKLQIGHVNDIHSSFVDDRGGHPISRLSTAAKQMRAEASAKGITTHTINAGDEFGGTEIDSSTENGRLENVTIQKALEPTVRMMGNHAVDKSDSVVQWLRNAAKLHNETGDINTVVSNITFDKADLAKHAQVFVDAGLDPRMLSSDIVGTGPDSIVRPYTVKDFNGAHGVERVGYIGLVTEDLDPLGVRVNDGAPGATPNERSIAAAKLAVQQFKADPTNEGVNKLILVSHLGRDTDIEVAKHVDSISAIVGAHSHDAQPTPLWIRNPSGWNVPVVQAGNDAKWLGDLTLAFKADGSGAVDKYHTTGKLRPLTQAVEEDPAINEFIQQQPFYARVRQLHEAEGYGSIMARSDFAADNVRAKPTELGITVSDGIHAGVNQHLSEIGSDVRINGVLKHSGDIRKPIPGGVPLTGWHFTNLFCNGENNVELTVANMTGEETRRALEYGVHDIPGPENTNAPGDRFRNLTTGVFKGSVETRPDYSGNFLQVSGLRYDVDLSAPAIQANQMGGLSELGGRIKNMEVWIPPNEQATVGSWQPGVNEAASASTLDDQAANTGSPDKQAAVRGRWEPIDLDATYKFASLFHPIDKWAKSGIYDDILGIKPQDYQSASELKNARVSSLHARFETESGVNFPKIIDNQTSQIKRGLGLSQPKLIVDYLSGKTRLPDEFFGRRLEVDAAGDPIVDPGNLGAFDGRINNVTPQSEGASWKAVGAATFLSADTRSKSAVEDET